MTASATSKTTDTLRGIAAAVGMAARQLARPRTVATVLGITILVVVFALVPLPTAVQLRDWAQSVGPWFPLAFLLAHALVTVMPFPRTAFTLASGLLFGPLLGVVIAVVGSTASGLIALLLVRVAGWRLNRLVRHRAIDTVNERLRERAWPTVLSLRLIPVVPFAAINYAAGASAVRVLPYTLATVAGLLPGTAAVVILGDALAGDSSPWLFVVSVCTGALGLAGLVLEIRNHRQAHRKASHRDEHDHEPAVAH